MIERPAHVPGATMRREIAAEKKEGGYCVQCGCMDPAPAPCWNALEKRNAGFFCGACGHFENAIGRERKIKPAKLGG
jgi:hypothetical protein